MYQVISGMGQVMRVPPTVPAPRRVVVGPRRVFAQGPGGHWWVRPRAGLKGIGCGCGCGGDCNQGIGQAQSVSQVATDFTTVLGDVFLNSDGSLNWTAIGFAGLGAILLYVNWGNTTKKRYKGK